MASHQEEVASRVEALEHRVTPLAQAPQVPIPDLRFDDLQRRLAAVETAAEEQKKQPQEHTAYRRPTPPNIPSGPATAEGGFTPGRTGHRDPYSHDTIVARAFSTAHIASDAVDSAVQHFASKAGLPTDTVQVKRAILGTRHIIKVDGLHDHASKRAAALLDFLRRDNGTYEIYEQRGPNNEAAETSF